MGNIISKILAVLHKREKKRLWFLLLLDTLISIVDIVSLAVLLFVINVYAQPGTAARYSFLPAWLLDKNSLMLVGCFLFVFLLKSVGGYLILRARYRFIYGVASRLSEDRIRQYLEGSFMDYVNIDSAVHIRKINQEPIEFCHYMLAGAQQIVTESVLIIVSICGIIWYDAWLFLLLFLLMLPAVAILSFTTRKKIKTVRSVIMTSGEKAIQYLQETLNGFVESNIYDRNLFFTGRYARHQQELNDYLAELQISQGMPSRLIEVFAVLGLFILIVVNKFLPAGIHAATFVTLGAFMAAAYKIIPGIVRISNISGQMRTYEFTLNDLSGAVPAADPGEVMRAGEEPGVTAGGADTIQSMSCRGIGFRYDKHKVLDGLNLHIEAGDFLGIQGGSGKGKTTLLNIILGFLEQEEGEILFNKRLSGKEDRKKYWRNISYVKQQPFLLHDTILTNITMNGKDYDEDRLQRAVSLAGLEPVIGQLKEGIQKMIVENGKNISGGQRKRIAMARALYKKADLMILDEPFSELDERSEERLLAHFNELAGQGMCIILITHNRKSLSSCNKIVYLDE